MGTVDLIAEAARFGALLSEAVRWCDRITLCLSAPRSERGTAGAWPDLLAARAKLDRVIVHDADAAEGWLLHRFHETSTLRLIQGPSRRFDDQLLWFERGAEVQLFLARSSLARTAFRGDCGAVVRFRGESTEDFALSFWQLIDQWREAARVPTGNELDALTTAVRPRTATEESSEDRAALSVVTEIDVLRRSIAELLGIAPVEDERTFARAVSEEGETSRLVEADSWRLALTHQTDGVRLELTEEGRGDPVELMLRAAESTGASSGLLLTDATGHRSLAWRGGLLGSSEKKNHTLWSQCRLPTLEVHTPASDAGAEKAERVALVAREGAEFLPQLTAFAEEVQRLRDLLAPRKRLAAASGHSDFATLDRSEQAALVWAYLIGAGSIPLDEAVSISAQGLREDSYVQYQRLRRDGALYELLSQLLTREASEGTRFDRPQRGHVRAIQPELDSYGREDWLDCLVNALPAGEVLDRATVMRSIFNYARDVWGLDAQRLRSGGKSEKALKGVINSAIRRGLLRRIGAAYLEKVSASTPDCRESHVSEGASRPEPDARAATAPITDETLSAEPTSPDPELDHETTNASQPADDPLVRPLHETSLPVRALNWAERKGLATLRDFVAWHPDAFAAEPNVGRRTVTEARVVVEGLLGREWEEVWGVLDEPKTPPPGGGEPEPGAALGPLPSPDQSRWNGRQGELSEAHQGLPLTRLALPARMRGYCEQQGLETVGDLFAIPRDELLAQPNLGRATLIQTLEALDSVLGELEQPDHDDDLLSAWRKLVQRLPALQRMILVRRSGSHGPRETLEALGETLGLTRERVRQIEARCLDDIRQRSALPEALEKRMTQALAGGRCVPLDLLIEDDPWWKGIEQRPDWADYLFERLFGSAVHRVVLEQRDQVTTFFARFTQEALQEARKELLAAAEQIATPARLTDYEPLLERAVQRLDPAMRDALQVVLEDQLELDESDPERVLVFGNTKPDRVIALLASQPEPISVNVVFEALGRCRFPDEVLYFKRGVVGLEQHFPDFRLWLERLVPACLELMRELPPGRQWMVTELHESLRDAGQLPEWLGHWHLASLLRRSGQVDYLGRLRVALRSEGNRRERIHLSDAVLTVLQTAGAPLPIETIAERVRQQTDIRDGVLSSLLIASPFVKIRDNLYGLIERDVPGGSPAIARAVEGVVEILTDRQRGLTAHQAFQVASTEVGADWSSDLVMSLLRSEPQLRLSRSGHVGLSSWDDVRAPTRGEFIRQLVEKAGGRLELDVLQATLLDVYGRELERSELSNECSQNELQLDGSVLVFRVTSEAEALPESRVPELEVPPSPSVVATPVHSLASDLPEKVRPAPIIAVTSTGNRTSAPDIATTVDLTGRVQGIPAAARQHFEELLRQPPQPPAELLERARAHLAEIESAGHHNEFIDVSLARTLVERMERLLERVQALSPITRRIAHGAVLYFISTEDAEDDFDLGGLEDDEAVLNAVIAHLELS